MDFSAFRFYLRLIPGSPVCSWWNELSSPFGILTFIDTPGVQFYLSLFPSSLMFFHSRRLCSFDFFSLPFLLSFSWYGSGTWIMREKSKGTKCVQIIGYIIMIILSFPYLHLPDSSRLSLLNSSDLMRLCLPD